MANKKLTPPDYDMQVHAVFIKRGESMQDDINRILTAIGVEFVDIRFVQNQCEFTYDGKKHENHHFADGAWLFFRGRADLAVDINDYNFGLTFDDLNNY